MNIGELARAAETKAETIRYYERIGLMPEPARTAGNYRDYSATHVSRLTFTRRARDLGFSIEEIQMGTEFRDRRRQRRPSAQSCFRKSVTTVQDILAASAL
jgi:DNA-binding transcriptional MerR regulator